MVWFKTWDNRTKNWIIHYESDIVTARRKAIALMDGGHYKFEHVSFFRRQTSRNEYATIHKLKGKNGVYYEWSEWTSTYGTKTNPLYKNGKIMR